MKWSQSNKILINCNKTKEIIIGKPKSDNIPLLQIDGRQIQRVSHFKKRVSHNNLITYSGIGMSNTYVTKSLPNFIYQTPKADWLISLTSTLSDQLESYQKEQCGLFMATKLKECLIMVALCNRADHIYFHAVVCSSSFFFFFLA